MFLIKKGVKFTTCYIPNRYRKCIAKISSFLYSTYFFLFSNTPLHLSASCLQSLEVSYVLVEHGARIEDNDIEGVRPVDLHPVSESPKCFNVFFLFDIIQIWFTLHANDFIDVMVF